jgi:hypothetical protein
MAFPLGQAPPIFEKNVSTLKGFVNRTKILAYLPSRGSLFCEKVSLWPGSKGIAREKHRREKKSIRRSPRASAERGGPIGRPAGRPYNGLTLFLGKEGLARPV